MHGGDAGLSSRTHTLAGARTVLGGVEQEVLVGCEVGRWRRKGVHLDDGGDGGDGGGGGGRGAQPAAREGLMRVERTRGAPQARRAAVLWGASRAHHTSPRSRWGRLPAGKGRPAPAHAPPGGQRRLRQRIVARPRPRAPTHGLGRGQQLPQAQRAAELPRPEERVARHARASCDAQDGCIERQRLGVARAELEERRRDAVRATAAAAARRRVGAVEADDGERHLPQARVEAARTEVLLGHADGRHDVHGRVGSLAARACERAARVVACRVQDVRRQVRGARGCGSGSSREAERGAHALEDAGGEAVAFWTARRGRLRGGGCRVRIVGGCAPHLRWTPPQSLRRRGQGAPASAPRAARSRLGPCT